jgi:hypothetical protein
MTLLLPGGRRGQRAVGGGGTAAILRCRALFEASGVAFSIAVAGSNVRPDLLVEARAARAASGNGTSAGCDPPRNTRNTACRSLPAGMCDSMALLTAGRILFPAAGAIRQAERTQADETQCRRFRHGGVFMVPKHAQREAVDVSL